MKRLTEKQGLERLKRIKGSFQNLIAETYEPNAKSCTTCVTKGACCLDAHFVNVHITRLEAVAIHNALEKLPTDRRDAVFVRNAETIRKYSLDSGYDSFSKTFACPLFEKNAGCLVHEEGKPSPCIQHACYENKSDLPPDELQTKVENQTERLNFQVYRNAWNWLPLPVWLLRCNRPSKS
jgi:hypothetical protein